MELIPVPDINLVSRYSSYLTVFDDERGQLNLSNLADDDDFDSCLAALKPVESKVKDISLTRSTLSPKYFISVLSSILQDRIFFNLRRLDISYCNLPEIVLNYLCDYVNPFSGGYNISSLNVTRCGLGVHGVIKLLTALFANITMEELILTGNMCGDKAIPVLVTMLTKYDSIIHTLCIGSNSLTSTGIRQLCSVLQLPKRSITHLLLGGNVYIGDEVVEELFVALNKGDAVTSLSLSNINLHRCEWARYLPFMNKLTTLDISFNVIDDDEFGKLCKALERTSCVSHLDLAHNRFGGIKCNVIEQMIATNGALLSLSLSGNRCEDSVWTALHRGLLCNGTLLSLNLSDCNITMVNALEICKCFRKNEILSIDFSNNPLPEEFISNPRVFAAAKVKPTGAVNLQSGPAQNQIQGQSALLPLSEQAHALSAARSRLWCSTVAKEVAMSLNTLNIVANRSAIIAAAGAAVVAGSPSVPVAPFSPGATQQTSTHNYPTDKPNPAHGLSLTSPVLIAQSEHYLSPTKLRELVAQSDLANTSKKLLMHVAYGRAPLVIGSIEVTSLTTYGEALDLVRPLVQEYVSTIAANETIYQELVNKYSLMDAAGETLTKEHFQLRRVWPEFCEIPEPVLVVRPGNWVKL